MSNSPPLRVRRDFLLVLAASLGMAGCGSSTGTVKGKVSYNGVLLKGGTVTFYCADGRSVPTAIREDGSYALEKLPLGKAKICVDTSALDPKRRKTYSYAPPPGSPAPPGFSSPGPGQYLQIPAKYADPAKTDLTWDVTGGGQTLDVEMK